MEKEKKKIEKFKIPEAVSARLTEKKKVFIAGVFQIEKWAEFYVRESYKRYNLDFDMKFEIELDGEWQIAKLVEENGRRILVNTKGKRLWEAGGAPGRIIFPNEAAKAEFIKNN